MKLSLAQKIAKFFSSKSLFEKMEADSRTWLFDCSDCGTTSSIWDVGGIRYKAKGKPLTGIWCPHCRKFGMRKIYKK